MDKEKQGVSLAYEERIRQIAIGYDLQHDLKVNDTFQLSQAAQVLSKEKITREDEFQAPFNWDEEHWVKLCKKPYKERLIISSALLMAEFDRVEAMEEVTFEQTNDED